MIKLLWKTRKFPGFEDFLRPRRLGLGCTDIMCNLKLAKELEGSQARESKCGYSIDDENGTKVLVPQMVASIFFFLSPQFVIRREPGNDKQFLL